ncbi:MAG: glycosyltransferase [Caldilineaceae bacterium]
MRTLFLTGREIEYARNEVLLRAFRRFSTVDIMAGQKNASLLVNSLRLIPNAYARLLRHHYDIVFIGFYGYFILRALGNFIRQPTVFDAFVSNYDTLCFDRKQFAPNSLAGKTAYWLDRSTCQKADHILLDTQAHVAYFQQNFGLIPSRCSAIPVGCSDEIYWPRPPAANRMTKVLYYSTFLPLHGVEIIVQAASLLKDEPITFHLIGAGPLLAEMQTMIQQRQLTNVTLTAPVSPRVLADKIADADICLGGHFGQSEKAGRVIPGKIYQMLAVGRAVIAADAPGNRELLRHRETAFLIPPADPMALANAIRILHAEPTLRTRLAVQGRQLYEKQCSEAVITKHLHQIVKRMVV